jgi:Tfp pilus assembly protein FimV
MKCPERVSDPRSTPRKTLSDKATGLGAAVLLAMMFAAPANAREDALRTLLGSLADGEELAQVDPVEGAAGRPGAGRVAANAVARATPAAAPAGRTQVVVRPGETLDGIIRRTLAESPYKETWLRRAFVQLNPAAFERGNTHRLKAGAVLLVPTDGDVLALLDDGRPAPGVPSAASTGAGTSAGMSQAPSAADERRKWVRFP